jgi:uncharacterized OsmC-like protein
MKVTKERTINGVDVEKLRENIGAMKENPALAKFKFRVRNRWIKAGHNHTTIKDFYGLQKDLMHEKPFELDAGEHQVLLSEDEGPNPVEYLLTAIASCVTSALVYHAAAKGIEVKGVESRVEGDIDLRGFLGISPDVKVGYKQVRLYFKIDADISDEQKEELIRMGQKFSPVYNSVTVGTPVLVQLEK